MQVNNKLLVSSSLTDKKEENSIFFNSVPSRKLRPNNNARQNNKIGKKNWKVVQKYVIITDFIKR